MIVCRERKQRILTVSMLKYVMYFQLIFEKRRIFSTVSISLLVSLIFGRLSRILVKPLEVIYIPKHEFMLRETSKQQMNDDNDRESHVHSADKGLEELLLWELLGPLKETAARML